MIQRLAHRHYRLHLLGQYLNPFLLIFHSHYQQLKSHLPLLIHYYYLPLLFHYYHLPLLIHYYHLPLLFHYYSVTPVDYFLLTILILKLNHLLLILFSFIINYPNFAYHHFAQHCFKLNLH